MFEDGRRNMVTESAKTFALVVSAIKNLRELKGSTSKEILNYLQAVYNVVPNSGRRQMQAALKRGVAYGILKKNGSHYVLPTSNETKCQEIAAQELNLLDFCRRNIQQRQCPSRRKRSRHSRGRKTKKKKCTCKKRSRSGRRRKRSRLCRCGKSQRRKRKKICRCGKSKRRRSMSEHQASMEPKRSTEVNDSSVSVSASGESVSSMED